MFSNSAGEIPQVVSCVVSAFRLMIPLTIATLTLVCDGGCVCSFVCSINSSVGDSFSFALQLAFLRTHFHVASFARFY